MIASFWFNRFQVRQDGDYLVFRDMLYPSPRKVLASEFEGLNERDKVIAYFTKGFLSSCIEPFPNPVGFKPKSASDFLFWQFPCLTEYHAFLNHKKIASPFYDQKSEEIHLYVGMPWATFIDKSGRDSIAITSALTRLTGIKNVLQEVGVTLRSHTVCQHVYWPKLWDLWKELGITDVWLSHAEENLIRKKSDITIHPWSLFAVNVEDEDRRIGIEIAKPNETKKYLASFIGAHFDHYVSKIRKDLKKLSEEEGFYIEIKEKWHFEDVVYKHQAQGLALLNTYRIDDSVISYNKVLSDSVFSLCPSGAGPNSLRLWESLAVGSIPILLGEIPAFPKGGSLDDIDWMSICYNFTHMPIEKLPQFLRSIPINEIYKRQKTALEAYAKNKRHTCF